MKKIYTVLLGIACVFGSAGAYNVPVEIGALSKETKELRAAKLQENKAESLPSVTLKAQKKLNSNAIEAFKTEGFKKSVAKAPASIVGNTYVTLYNDGDDNYNSFITVEAGTNGGVVLKNFAEGYDVNGTYDAATGKLTIPVGVVIGTYSTYGNVTLYSLNDQGQYSSTTPITATVTDDVIKFETGVYAAVSAGGLCIQFDIAAYPSNGTFTATANTSGAAMSAPLLVTKTSENTLIIVGINVGLNSGMFTNGKPYGMNLENEYTLNATSKTVTAEFEPYDNYGSYGDFYYGMIVSGYLDDFTYNVAVANNVSTFSSSSLTFYGYLNGSSYSGMQVKDAKITVNMDVFNAPVTGGNGGGDEDGEWTNIGNATLMDGWVLPAFGIDQTNKDNWYEVPLEQNNKNKNIYRLVDPYHQAKFPALSQNTSKTVGYIVFDVTDPDHVVINLDQIEAGFANSSLGITKFYCYNSLAFYSNYLGYPVSTIVSAIDDIPYTTYKNGVISLGSVDDPEYGIQYDATFGYQSDKEGGYVWTDNDDNVMDMSAMIIFPGATPPEDDDTDTPEVDNIYYSLDRENLTAEVTGCAASLTALNIPASITVKSGEYNVTSVAREAFYGNKNITTVTIPASIESVAYDAFRNVQNLRTLYIADLAAWCGIEFENGNANPIYNVYPTSQSQWGKVYIAGEEAGQTITIPEGVTSIGRSFYGYKPLVAVNFPSTLTVIGDQAFANCENLLEVVVPDGVTEIGSAFWQCTSLTSAVLPASLTNLKGSTFYNDRKLESVNLPEGLTNIGSMTFYNCLALTELTFPSTLENIGMMAFDSCTGVTKITSYAEEVPTALTYAFDGIDTSIPVYVPYGTIDAYKAAAQWEDFTNYIELPKVVADKTIEGAWYIKLNGHYLGEYSLGEFVGEFNATVDGNTVTFESTDSQYNIVAEFLNPTTLSFTQVAVGNTGATYVLTQQPYVNHSEVSDLEDLTEQEFTAIYNSDAGTIVFPDNSGLRYGYFNADGELSNWDDAFDFVTASRELNAEPATIAFEGDITAVSEESTIYVMFSYTTSNVPEGAKIYADFTEANAENSVSELVTENPAYFEFADMADGDYSYSVVLRVVDAEGNTIATSEAKTFSTQVSGVEGVGVDAADAKYYNLQGVEVAEPANGIFIKVQGNKTSKVIIK